MFGFFSTGATGLSRLVWFGGPKNYNNNSSLSVLKQIQVKVGQKLVFVRQQTVKPADGKRKEGSWPPVL